MRDDTQKRPEELEAEIKQSRERIGNTVDAIQAKFSPGQVVDQVMDYFRSNGSGNGVSQFTSNLGATIRDNPMPVALIGAGMAWLMLGGSSRNGGHHHSHYLAPERTHAYDRSPAYYDRNSSSYEGVESDHRDYNTDPYPGEVASNLDYGATDTAATEGVRHKVGEAAAHFNESTAHVRDRAAGAGAHIRESVANANARMHQSAAHGRERIGAAADSARARMSEAMDSAQARASRAAESARYRAHQLGDQAHYQAERAKQGFSQMLEEQPLVLAGVGLAIGALLGAGLPPTRREDELMGETRDKMLERTRNLAEEQYHRSQAIVNAAINSARSEAERQHVTLEGGEELAQGVQEKIQRVAQQAMDAAAQEVERQNLTPEAGEAALREVKDKLEHIAQAAWDGAKQESNRQGVTADAEKMS